ncbi:MAG: helix-turn-helix domain-containing protein [Ferruginibacter sp.]
MKHISILVPEDAVLASITDPRYMFSVINEFLSAAGNPPMFHVQMVGLTSEVHLNRGVFTVHTDALLKDIKRTDLIIVPALSGELKTAIEINRKFIPWIIEQNRSGAEVASLCLGAFLLAATGLLDNKKCSTHWSFTNEFRAMFPKVNLVDDKIITEEDGIYTSGGATSYWNLLLYLVEKFTNRETAILASKYFVLEIDRRSQSPFTIFNGQKNHEDDTIKEAQEFIEENWSEKISVGDLAYKFAIGRRHFERRFKKATNNTPVEYMQRVKIEAAKKSLEGGRKNVNEVMYEVGYSDTKAFRNVFKKVTGLSPVDYRNKYTRDIEWIHTRNNN